MASALTFQSIRSRFSVQCADHDPGAATAVIFGVGGSGIIYADMRDNTRVLGVVVQNSAGLDTGQVLMEMVAATDAAFTTPVVVKTSGAIATDAVGDWYCMEVDATELPKLGAALRYVTGRLTGAAAEECSVMLVAESRTPGLNLTAEDNISA
jgi:hypothetical protein